jgi:hypothetical protein
MNDESIFEHPIVNMIRQELPIVRPLTNYWVESIRKRREQNLYYFLDDVAKSIVEIKSGLDEFHLKSEEFEKTLAGITELAMREQDEDKRKYLKQFVLNYATCHRPDISLKKIFFQYISELSGMHLVLLNEIYKSQGKLDDEDLRVLSDQLDRIEAQSLTQLSKKLKIDQELLSIMAMSLEAKSLLEVKFKPGYFLDKDPKLILRPLARRFLDFLNS